MTLSIAALSLSVALAARPSPVPAAPSGRSAAEWAAYNRARAQRGLLPRKATRGATRVSPALATTRIPAPIASPVPAPAATSVCAPHAGPRATGHGMREPGTGDGHGDGDGASSRTPAATPTAARPVTVRHPSAAIARAAPERSGPSGAQVDLEGGVLRAGLDGAAVEVRFVARVGGLTLAVERPAAPR